MDSFNSVSLGLSAGVVAIFVAAAWTFATARRGVEELAREISEADVMSKMLPPPSTSVEFLTLLNKARNLREQCIVHIRTGKLYDAITCARQGRAVAKSARSMMDSKIAEAIAINKQERDSLGKS